jgi:hypothetical protein
MDHETVMLAALGLISTFAGYLIKQNTSLRKEVGRLYIALLEAQRNDGNLNTELIHGLDHTDP